MSKPYIYNNIDSFLDDLEEDSKFGELPYNKDEAKEFMRGLQGNEFDEAYFDEGWSKRTIGSKIPEKTLTDKPYGQLSFKEREELQSQLLPYKQVEKTLTYDPNDPIFQLDLVTPKTMFGLEEFVDDKLLTEIEDKNLNEVETQRLIKNTYENMFGGEIPLTTEGELIPKALGMTQKEFLNLSKSEKYLLANRYRDFNFTGFEKFNLALSQGTKELSLSNFSGNDPQGKHSVQQQYIELARMLDDRPDLGFGYGMGVLLEGLTVEAKEQFEKNNELASTQFSPKAQILYNRLTKKISEITLDTQELQKETYTPDIQKQIVENQMVLYGLVDKINEMINSPDLKISRDAVEIKPLSEDDASYQYMRNTVLKDAKNRDNWTEQATQRIIDAGGGLNFSPTEQSTLTDKALQFAKSNIGELLFARERPKEMLIEQLENRLGDLKRNEADNDEIARIEGLLTKAKELETPEGIKSEFLDVLFGSSYEDAIETIRKINLETVGDEDEYLNEMMSSMSLLDSYVHDAVGVDESSLDGDKLRIREMNTGIDFLLDPQIKTRLFEGLPKYMQAIFLQNITRFDDGRDVTVENLKDMTVEDIAYATDIGKNLDTDDLKRFVNYRDQVVLSGPGQLMQFMIDIGSTPTFNPHTQTFTKEMNDIGRFLFSIAPFAQRVVTEGFVGLAVAGADGGYSYANMPSWSSRVAAKIAIGDPGMMGDLPYIVHLYGGDEKAEILAEYIGLGLDFFIPSERILYTKPMQRVGKTFGKLDYPRVKKGDTVSPQFRESMVEATVGLPNGMEYVTNIALPAFALGETLLTGSGLGLATEMAYQFKQTLKGEGEISPKTPRNYNQLEPKEQALVDEVINHQIDMGRRYNIQEVISVEEAFNIKTLIEDGMDPENPKLYAEIKFNGDEEMQTAFVNNTKKTIKGIKDRLEVMGISPDEVFVKMKANKVEDLPYLFARGHMIYEENTTIPKNVRDTESYQNVEKIIFGREDLSPAEKNAWMGNLYVNAELLFPDNPKQFFDQAYFDNKPITQVAEQSFDNVSKFYAKVQDESVTANELMMTLADEPISTRGVANFYAAFEIDGIPALFEDTTTEISKGTVSKHYTRSLERSSKFETKDYGGSIQTSKFLDTQYEDARSRKTKLANVESLLSQERILTERGDMPEELAKVKKELDKGGRGRSLREKYEKALTDEKIYAELGSEQYLVDQRIKKRVTRIQESERFKMSDEQKAVLGQIEDMTVDAETLREAEFLKTEKSIQDALLNEMDFKKKIPEIRRNQEQIAQLKQELSVTDDFLERQAIIEKIEQKQSFLNDIFFRKGLDEKNVKIYDLGGKNEKARVRFVDENDGVYRVETMRSVTSQKETLNPNKELYYRSEYTKAILEDASANGYKTVTIPLGDVGIFHETMGKRVKTQDYYMLLQNRKRIKEMKDLRTQQLEGLNEVPEESKPALREDIENLNKRIEISIADDERMFQNLKKTESHSFLNAIEDKFVEIITDYVADIDENIKVERTDDGLVVHLTEDFRNVIGRTIEEEPTVYFEKGVQFVAPKEDLPILPRLEINEEQINSVKEARKKLQAKSNQLEEKIKNAKDTRKFIQIENKNIQIELQRLKDFEDTGFFESDGSVQFFKREDGKIVVSIGDYNIVGREFLKGDKKGFLFESLVDKKTGEEVQTTVNELTERAAAYEKFKNDALEFSKEVEEFVSFLKYFEAYTENRKLGGFRLTKDQYIEFRQKLGVTSEPLDFEKSNLNNLLEGEKKRIGRKDFVDETTIDPEFKIAFIDKANKIRDLFKKEGIEQTTFIRDSRGGLRDVKTIQNEIKTRNKNILTRFEEKHESINTTVLRYLGSEFESEYTQQLKNTQDLKMSSLNVSETTKLITEMLSRQYDMFGFDAASGHMLQNFADVFDQVGTASSPDLIRTGKKIVPVLNIGMTKDMTKSFFGQELSASINTDVRIVIDYLGRNKLSKTEQAKLNTMRKLFNIDETLPLEEQKAKLQEGNDMYQTYQTKRTDQTYHGLRKKSLQRLIDGIDEIYKDLPKTKQVDRALLMEKQKELIIQMEQYKRLENEAVVFTFGGDKLHTDIMHFAADQTEGFGRMQGVMNDIFDPAVFDFDYENMVMNMERVSMSYVENMVLDSAQLGFDSIGFEKSLLNSRSVEILRNIAQRFGKNLEEAVVFDRSGEIPVKYEFISFKLPNELKENVSNVTRTRFVRSIKTQDPVRLNGSHILQMIEDGEMKIRTPYGELELTLNNITNFDKEAIFQIVSDVNKEINRVDFYNLFDSTEFEGVAPEIAQDYQQSMYAKGVAYEFQKALEDYVQFRIKGLDEIENVSIDKLKRASKPIEGEVTFTYDEAEALDLLDDNVFDYDETQAYRVRVEPIEGSTLSFVEMVALEKGIGLNETLIMLQERLIQNGGDYTDLGFALQRGEIIQIVNQDLPPGFVESSFGQHPQAAFTPLLPLLFEQWKQRFGLLDNEKIVGQYETTTRLIDAEPTIARPQIEQGDVVSQIEIDGNRLKIKLSDTMTFNDFLVTNANILEMMMPDTAYKHMASHYDSVGGRLTSQGVQQFASEMMYYIKNDVSPDLRTRAMFDHSLGYLSRWWDVVHRQDVPQGLNAQFNTIFNPHGKALSQAVTIGKKRTKYKIKVPQESSTLQKMKAEPSKMATAQLREKIAIPTQKVLLEQLNASPSVRKLQKYAVNDQGQPLYRFGEIKVGDEIDPAFLFYTLYGMTKADEYKAKPRFSRGSKLAILDDLFSKEKVVQLTEKHFVPESVRDQVNAQVENQLKIIFGEDYMPKFTERGILEFDNKIRRHFISVVNSLGDTHKSFPQSLVDFVMNPRDRMHITTTEYNAFVDALREREVPYGFSNRSADVHQNMLSLATYKRITKNILEEMESTSKLKDFFGTFIGFVEKYFTKEDILADLPPTLRGPFLSYIGELKKTTSDISRRMRELAANGEEGRNLQQRLERLDVPEAEIDEMVNSFMLRNNTHKRMSSMQLIIQENLLELERVDRHKLDLFFRLYDEIVDTGFKDGTTIFDMFTFEKLDQIENVFTSRKFGISDSEMMSIKFIREMLEDFQEQKKLNPNKPHEMNGDNSATMFTAINEVQNGLMNRYNYLDSIGDEVFRRFTGYTKVDSGLDGYTTIINRKLLTLLFEGRYIHEPSIDIVRKHVRVEDIFATNEKGQIYFKASGEILTKKSARDFLFANGYGFIDKDGYKLFKSVSQEITSDLTVSQLSEVVTEIIRTKEADSIQTFLAVDKSILNNFLAIDPNTGRHDMLAVLGGLGILTHEKLASQRLADRLSRSSFQDLDQRIAQRREQYGNYFIDDMEIFRSKVVTYMEQMISGTMKKNPSDNPNSKPIMIIDGKLPEPSAPLLEIEAHNMAMDIIKDLELPIQAARKNVAEIDINGQKYILPKDFIQGLERIRQEVIGSLTLGRYGESEILDNMVLYEAERTKLTDLIDEDIKNQILENSTKPRETVVQAIVESVKQGTMYTGIAQLVALALADGLSLGAVSLTLAGFSAMESLKFSSIRKLVNDYAQGIFGDKLDAVKTQMVADNLFHQILTRTYHVFEGQDKEKLMQIKRKYEGAIPIALEKNLVKLSKGAQYGLFGATAMSVASSTFGFSSFINPYIGLLAGGTFVFNKLFMETDYFKGLTRKEANAQFVKDIQNMYTKVHRPLLDEIGELQMNPESRRKFNAYLEEAKRLRTYVESKPYKDNVAIRQVDRLIGTIADTFNVPKISASIKMSVTALSGLQYWTTSFFGMMNQEHLDLGATPKFLATVGAGVATWQISGSFFLGLAAAKGARVVSEAMGRNFTFGKKKAQMYRGPTAMNRPSQIAMFIQDIQETSLGNRIGVSEGAYIGLGLMQMGIDPMFSAVGGVVSGFTYKVLLDKFLKSKKLDNSRGKFMLFTRGGKVYTYKEILQYMQTYDVLTTYVREETGQILASELRMLYPDSKLTVMHQSFLRSAMEVAESYDLYGRVGMFLDELEMGTSPKEAAEKVRNLYFDYSDLSDFEKKYLRNVFLFYSFMRKNIGFMSRKLLENPERIMGWARLTKGTQEMAFRDGDSDLYVGDFWQGRMMLPPTIFESFENIDAVGVPFRHRSVQVLPMTNVYDMMMLSSAISSLPLISNDNSPFYRYLLTSMGPVGQAAIIPITEEIPFTQAETRFQNISPRMIQMSQRFFGYAIYGPKGSGAFIEYESSDLQEKLRDGHSTLATAERKKFKEPNPLEGRIYRPATNADGFNHFVYTNMILPATHRSALGMLAFPFMPSGRPARSLEAIDRLDLMEQMTGASIMNLGLRVLGFQTNQDLIAQAQVEMQRRGMDIQDPKKVGEYAKEMVKGALAVEMNRLKVSPGTHLSVITMADEYILTDDTPYNGLLGQMGGMPFIASPSDSSIYFQTILGLEKKLKE